MILQFHHFTKGNRKRPELETQTQGVFWEEGRRKNPKKRIDKVSQDSSNMHSISLSFSKMGQRV